MKKRRCLPVVPVTLPSLSIPAHLLRSSLAISKHQKFRTANHQFEQGSFMDMKVANSVPPRVLVVDDEEKNRMLLKDSLEVKGFEVDEAANGREALERVAAHPPDAVLLDVMMPEMDGYETCRILKG